MSRSADVISLRFALYKILLRRTLWAILLTLLLTVCDLADNGFQDADGSLALIIVFDLSDKFADLSYLVFFLNISSVLVVK